MNKTPDVLFGRDSFLPQNRLHLLAFPIRPSLHREQVDIDHHVSGA